jgi:two-component system, response regulator YesN
LRVLIADDERLVREGLKSLIPWRDLGCEICGEAATGSEARAKIESLSPDLVLLDIRMPGVMGLDLAREVRRRDFKGKIIIISGYSDFAYAKSGFQIGVVDYLLKPISETELVEAVCRARDELDVERILSLYAGQSLKEARQNLLRDFVAGKVHWRPEILEPYGLAWKADQYQLLLYSFADVPPQNALGRLAALCDGLQADIFPVDGAVCVLLRGGESLARAARRFAPSQWQPAPYCVRSACVRSPEEIPTIYTAAKNVLDRRFFYEGSAEVIDCATLEAERVSSVRDLSELSSELVRHTAAGDTQRIPPLTEELERFFRQQDMPSSKAIHILLSVCTLARNECEFLSRGEGDVATAELVACDNLRTAVDCLRKHLLCLAHTSESAAQIPVARRVQEYAEKHFAQTLRLEDIAEHFGYNSAYLGKAFKSVTGESFHAFLDRLRVERAKELLGTGGKVGEISALCGYKDTEYFSRKFKSLTGCSPSEYQESAVR